MKKFNIELFHSPEEFLTAAKKDPSLYTDPKFFLLDFDFGHQSFTNGFQLAEIIRKHCLGKIFLYSDLDLDELPKQFDNRIPKEILTLEQLEKFSSERGVYELK